MVLTLSCFDINVFSISVFKWVFWIKLQWFLINCYTFSEWPYCRSHMIISRAITSSSKTISASVYIFTQEKYQFSFLIFFKIPWVFRSQGNYENYSCWSSKEREREVKSAHLEYQIAYTFSTWFSPRGSLAIFSNAQKENFYFSE